MSCASPKRPGLHEVEAMGDDPIVLALAHPEPDVDPGADGGER
ncbi:MAG TPA: hypothetical protein VGL51_01675 [Solirubrobacteraceae bacterium]|jgi:malic enzyme